jgi:hypothetical protein
LIFFIYLQIFEINILKTTEHNTAMCSFELSSLQFFLFSIEPMLRNSSKITHEQKKNSSIYLGTYSSHLLQLYMSTNKRTHNYGLYVSSYFSLCARLFAHPMWSPFFVFKLPEISRSLRYWTDLVQKKSFQNDYTARFISI